MKSTSKFPGLRSKQWSKAVFGSFLPFSKICFSGLLWCSMTITYSQRLRDRGGGLWNIICQIFFLSFSTLFSDFLCSACKSISQQNLLVKILFWDTLSFLYVWFCIQVGEHWCNWVLVIMLCNLSDSFYRNPHHLEDDFVLIICLWWFIYQITLGARDFSSAVSGLCQVFIVTRAKSEVFLAALAYGRRCVDLRPTPKISGARELFICASGTQAQ